MSTENIEKMSGHWLLARVGKKVLRPGGIDLTKKMLDLLAISSEDEIVEFAPGLGFTAHLALQKNPKSYFGIDADQKALNNLNKNFRNTKAEFRLGNAEKSNLSENSATKVYGEAMLSMQANHRKTEIIKEAARILKPNGYYAIHELSLTPENLDEATKLKIQRALANTMKVNARPLTLPEWSLLLKNEGFRIIKTEKSSMRLLEPARIIRDETFLGFLKIACKILTQPKILSRVRQMKKTFKKYDNHLCAVVILAQKI